jgi:outer membrane protein W
MYLGLMLNAQTYRFTSFPAELYFGVGPVIYQGDLPSTSVFLTSGNNRGSFKELNLALTVGVGYRIHKRWAIRNNISYVSFAGNDAYDEKKKVRNLSFRTRMLEYTPLLEYSIVHWDIKANNR